MAFTVINSGDPGLASIIMQNLRHVNYGSALIPVNSTGSGANNTLDLGSSSYGWKDLYLEGVANIGTSLNVPSITGSVNFDNYTMFVDASNNRVNIGSGASPTSTNLAGIGKFQVESDVFCAQQMVTHNNSAGNFSILGFVRGKGSKASPSIVSNGDTVGGNFYLGYDGSTYQQCGVFLFEIDGTPAAGDMPGRAIIKTTPSGSTSPVERVRFNEDGTVNFGSGSFYVDAPNNRLGLGITNPSTELHLNNDTHGENTTITLTAEDTGGTERSGTIYLDPDDNSGRIHVGDTLTVDEVLVVSGNAFINGDSLNVNAYSIFTFDEGPGSLSNLPAIRSAGTIDWAGSNQTDMYCGAIRMTPVYNTSGSSTTDRHNYLDLNDITGTMTVTDACVIRLDAALGTHLATTSSDKTGNSVVGSLKVNHNGTIVHIPLYAS